MSETLLEDGKVVVGSLTGPASLGDDRALLQLTIHDGSDVAQLTRDEVRNLLLVMDEWLHKADLVFCECDTDWATPPAPWMDEAVKNNQMLLDIPFRVWLGRRHLGKRSISSTAADFLRLLGLSPRLLHDVQKRITA